MNIGSVVKLRPDRCNISFIENINTNYPVVYSYVHNTKTEDDLVT